MKTARSIARGKRAFTLLEMTVTMVVGVMIAAMLMALINQQFAFLKIFRSQNFLTEEAPLINNSLGRIIGQADRFRIHRTVAEALSGTSPVMSGGSCVLLYFRQPDGTMLRGIISWETRVGTGTALYYYTVPATGVLSTPDWTITKRPSAVTFAIQQGILRTTLTGPSSEQITYSGTMQQ